MAITTQLERRTSGPRLFDWLESEFPFFPALRALDREHAIRCEEYFEGDRYILRAELPGIDPEKDVEISIAGGVLRVHAERRETKKEERRSEFTYGSLSRALTLPQGANEESVTASYQDGILQITVVLPEPAVPEPKKIPVEREPIQETG